MAYGKGYKIPADSILRKGILLTGVPRQEQPSDPMKEAEDQIERFLEAKHAKANRDPLQDDPNREETEEDGIRAEAIRRLGVRRMVEKAVSKK